MILREATHDDLKPLVALCERTWPRINAVFDTGTHDRLQDAQKDGVRVVVLYEESELVAGLGALPLRSDRGLGYEILLFVVDLDHRDRVKFLDALSLYCLNLALSEGRSVVHSRRPKATGGLFYGRDFLGTETEGFTDEIWQWGDAKTMMTRILDRRPEWAPSL